MRKQKLFAWLLPLTIFVIGCAGHYGSNRNLPPRSDEPAATKADLDANDPTTHEKRHGDNDGKPAEKSNDLAITQAVRKAIADDSSLSMDAKNVKIVSTNGVVTLRGTVTTQQEKELVAARAERVDGVARVENRLEVR